MASLVLNGNTSGSVTISSPAVSGTTTLTLPTTSGTVIVNSGAQTIEFADGSAGAPSITNSGDTNTGMFFPAADTIAFAEGGVEAMRLDSSGNLLIGTTSQISGSRINFYQPNSSTDLKIAAGVTTGTNATYQVFINNTVTTIGTENSSGGSLVSGSSAYSTVISNNGAYPLSFGTNNNERMRIDSSGHVYVGTTTFVPGEGNTATGAMIANTGKAFFSNGSDSAINANRNNDGGLIVCRRSGNTVGSISVTSSATAYNTSSDYRLKENIAPMIGALDTVAQLKPVTYKWKIDGSDGQGFIAHELQEVVPDCVTGEKDAVETYTDEEGNEQTRIKPQGIDTSFLVATLTAAIQEQQTIIESLKTDIAELKAKVNV